MKYVELGIIAANADRRALHKFVEDLQTLQDLPSALVDMQSRSDDVIDLKIRYPLNVFDRSVNQFMAVLFGEIPFMRAFGQARFEELTLPEEVYEWFGGPAFGAPRILERFEASEPPLLVAILKPSLDLNGTLGELERRI